MNAWVLMAFDGHRDTYGSWHPAHVFNHEPTLLEIGRALFMADVPWGDVPWEQDWRGQRKILDYCRVEKVAAS